MMWLKGLIVSKLAGHVFPVNYTLPNIRVATSVVNMTIEMEETRIPRHSKNIWVQVVHGMTKGSPKVGISVNMVMGYQISLQWEEQMMKTLRKAVIWLLKITVIVII